MQKRGLKIYHSCLIWIAHLVSIPSSCIAINDWLLTPGLVRKPNQSLTPYIVSKLVPLLFVEDARVRMSQNIIPGHFGFSRLNAWLQWKEPYYLAVGACDTEESGNHDLRTWNGRNRRARYNEELIERHQSAIYRQSDRLNWYFENTKSLWIPVNNFRIVKRWHNTFFRENNMPPFEPLQNMNWYK